MIDELIYAGDEHLDPEYVDGYDQKSAVDPVHDIETLTSHGLNEESVVVDLGAGTGLFARAIASHCRRVVAVDVSDAMLAILDREIKRDGIDNIEVIRAGLLSYEHEGGAPNFVYCRNTLHHLPNGNRWLIRDLKRSIVTGLST